MTSRRTAGAACPPVKQKVHIVVHVASILRKTWVCVACCAVGKHRRMQSFAVPRSPYICARVRSREASPLHPSLGVRPRVCRAGERQALDQVARIHISTQVFSEPPSYSSSTALSATPDKHKKGGDLGFWGGDSFRRCVGVRTFWMSSRVQSMLLKSIPKAPLI